MRTRLVLGGLLVLLYGCDSSTGPAQLPVVRDARVEAAAGPIFRTLELTLSRAAAVEVEYWRDGAPRLRVMTPAADAHAIFLPRLHASASYRYEARALTADGRRGPVYAGQFSTGSLPDDVARIELEATGTPTVPLVLLVVSGPATEFSGYVIVDGSGEIVWYLRALNPSGITQNTNGSFVYLAGGSMYAVTPAGAPVNSVPADPLWRRFHHDVIPSGDGRVLVIANDTQTVRGTHITGESIWEWHPVTGELRRRWTAFDFLDPFTDRGPRFSVGNWMHGNSLARGLRGNVLLSSNYLNQVMSIAPDFASLEWRLGGTNATVQVPVSEQFTGQHTAAELVDGRILLFDNRREQGAYSRAVEFDIAGGAAERVWEWHPARANFAPAVSSARRLPGGSTLVGFGLSAGLLDASGPTEVYEVSRDGAVLWHLEVGNVVVMYRAEPYWSIAGEVVVEGAR